MDKLQEIKESIMQHFDFTSFGKWVAYVGVFIFSISIESLTKIGSLFAVWITVVAGLFGLYFTWLKIKNQRKINKDSNL